jgi:hypothetical protein
MEIPSKAGMVEGVLPWRICSQVEGMVLPQVGYFPIFYLIPFS